MCPKNKHPETPMTEPQKIEWMNCPISRRDLMRGALGAGITLIGISCSDSSSSSPSDTETDTTEETDTPTQSDTETASGPSGDTETGAETDIETDAETDSTTDTGTDSATEGKSVVYVVKTDDRVSGLNELIGMLDLSFANGKDVLLKPNFNSSNAFPASTHDDTIRTMVGALRNAGCNQITLGESSGPSGTEAVIADKGTLSLCDNLNIDFMNFDNLNDDERETFYFDGMNWSGGLSIPKIFRSDHAVVLLPCLKTHSWGHFTLSLKLAVGITPRDRRWTDLHPGASGDRGLIAEINKGFEPDLIVMDGTSAFRTGGPDSGDVCYPGLLIAGKDRVAVDAVGVAVLKMNNAEFVSGTPIFEQEQIARAVEIGLGAASPDEIELVGNDDSVLGDIRNVLNQG